MTRAPMANAPAETDETIIGLIEQAIRDAGGHEGRAAAQIMDDLKANGFCIATDLKALVEREGLASATMSALDYGHSIGYNASVQWFDDSKSHGRGIATSRDFNSPLAAMTSALAERAVKLADEALAVELAA